MLRLLRIEFLKSWPSRYFRIMGGMWLFAFLSLPIAFKLFLLFLDSQDFSLDELPGLKATDLPIFDFVDIWQNLTYAYKCISIFLGILIIINVTNELDYKTFRQNIIDGMSKAQFLKSKVLLMLVLATGATLLITLFGLIIGFSFSPVTHWEAVTRNIGFLGAYWLHLLLFLSLCMLLSLFLKRAGIVIAIVLFWMFVVEPIIVNIIAFGFEMPELSNLLPFEASWQLIPRPIEKYGLRESRFWVSWKSVGVALAYLSLYQISIWRLLTKRDVK